MGLFGGTMNKDLRTRHVASLLGYDPSSPDTWPSELLEGILDACERAAEEKLHFLVTAYLRSGHGKAV